MTGPAPASNDAALDAARHLIAHGVPVFLARPAMAGGIWDPTGGTDGMGYWLPGQWQLTTPDMVVLDRWCPGDALGAVMGHGVDLLDVDPRNGGDASASALRSAGHWPKSYGSATTPSGGSHDLIASLGVQSRDGVRPGVDIKAGTEGKGHGFAFVAPTVRKSKVTGELVPYAWIGPPNLDGLSEGDDSGAGLANLIVTARGATTDDAGGGSFAAPDAFAPPFVLPEFIVAGQRDGVLYKYACSLQGKGVPYAEALRLMELDAFSRVEQPAGNTFALATALGKVHTAYGKFGDGSVPGLSTSTGPATDGPSSWHRVDLTSVLDGSYVQPLPTLMPRTDDVCLLYPGLTHSLHGESESGKSLLAQIECARLIATGSDVLFIDFESDAASVAHRLVTFGATPADILDHFHYHRPEVAARAGEDLAQWAALLTHRYVLAVIDGVTDALAVYGHATKENDDITAWHRAVPKVIAERTGAAVALIDHVTKDSDSRGRFAIGGQAKMSGLTGAAYVVEVAEALGRGLRGLIVLRVAKDRPGSVRPHCGPMRKSDRTQEAARIVIDSTDPENPVVTINPHRTAGHDDAGGEVAFRPTALMEKVSRAIEATPQVNRLRIFKAVKGRRQEYVIGAIDLLTAEGHIKVEDGPRNARLHTSLKPYRQANDPHSDSYEDRETVNAPEPLSTVSGPYTGDRETVTQPLPEIVGRQSGDSHAGPGFEVSDSSDDFELVTNALVSHLGATVDENAA